MQKQAVVPCGSYCTSIVSWFAIDHRKSCILLHFAKQKWLHCHLIHGESVVYIPICRQKTQTSHVSNDSDHVLYLSYLITGFSCRFHWNFVAFDLFALRMGVILGQCTKIFLLHFFTFFTF